MVDAWGRDERDEDPLAKLERLVNARTDRMAGAAAPAPGAGSLRGAIDDLYGTAPRPAATVRETVEPMREPMPLPDAQSSAVPDTFDLIADLDQELERVLRDTAPRDHGDTRADDGFGPLDLPPLDVPAPPVRATEPRFVPREPVELPASLLALRSAPPADLSVDLPPLPPEPSTMDLAPTLDEQDPLPRFLRHADDAVPADDFDAQLDADLDADLNAAVNGAVSDALAAATAAVAVTATQRPAASRPAAIAPLAVPAAPAYEVKPQPVDAPIEFGDDFERDLVDELLQIEPPLAAEADPLVAPIAMTGAGDEDDARPEPANDNGGRRRGIMVAAMLTGVAVVGGLSAFSLGGSDAPTEVALIRADPAPAKVRPAEPGGRTVPNQSNAVYERVAKVETAQAKAVAPSSIVDKTADVSAIREPVAVREATLAAAAKGADRLSAVDVSPRDVYAPRAVRTIQVRPDGTLVTGPTASETARTQVASAPVANYDPLARVEASTANAVVAAIEGELAPGTPLPRFRPAGLTTASLASPVRQAAVEVASAAPVAATAPATAPGFTPGGYVVQIASVPSADAARRTYGQMSSRFGSIIGGRGVDYQVANIPGKGTFHRVRIPAASKADASSTCSALKSAGGSCFVTR